MSLVVCLNGSITLTNLVLRIIITNEGKEYFNRYIQRLSFLLNLCTFPSRQLKSTGWWTLPPEGCQIFVYEID